MHIAIVGAGIAGLTCARQLQRQGHSVIVYEKEADVRGRMRTRQTELGGFDVGAQYFTADSERFRSEIASWRKAGWVSPWEGRFVTLDHGAVNEAGGSEQRFVGVPGMSSLVQNLAGDLEIRTEQLITRVEKAGDQWLLSVRSDTVSVEATAGPFDAVIVAVPADRAAALLRAASQFATRAEQAHLEPCWALMLGFQEPLGLGYDAAWVQGSRLSWIANDASKPQRRPGEHWIAHASVAWSNEHLDEDPERAKEKLLRAFHDATGSHVQPIYADVCLWRYAQATRPLPDSCLWDESLRIGACGDWFVAGAERGGRVENAFLSGIALAEAVQ